MRRLFALLLVAVLFAGCSSEAKTSNGASNNKKPVSPGQNSNSIIASNPDSPMNSDAEPSNTKLTPTRAEIREKLRQKNLINSPSSGPLPPPQFRPAPENSKIATTMNGEGAVIETRVFKNNPQLVKVEMTWAGPKDKTFKIFLKNGKVVEAKSDNIDNLESTPTSVLLKLAGMGTSR